MFVFFEHLRKLRHDNGSTQKQVAEFLKITERSYQKLEAGAAKPSYDSLIALADFFDVSLDYLVGRSDVKERR